MKKSCMEISLFILIIIAIFWIVINNNKTVQKTVSYNENLILSNSNFKNINLSTDHVKYLDGFTNSLDKRYLEYIRNNWIVEPTLYDTDITMESENDESEVGQSKFVAKLLGNKENGFFVESGAGNGWTMSNSLYLERKLKWKGLLIDPHLNLDNKNVKSRRNSFKSLACLSIKPFSQSNVTFIEKGYWSKIYKSENRTRKNKLIKVQCFPLNALLNSLSIEHVDYMSLDIEGEELAILQFLDFRKIIIDSISVEYRVSIGTPDAPFIDFEGTKTKLYRLRKFFMETKLYDEVGILPAYQSNIKYQEEYGLDVFFKRKKNTSYK